MDAAKMRAYVERWSEVAEFERAERRRLGPRPELAVQAALDLIGAFGRRFGWLTPADPLRRQENERVAESWSRLRTAAGRG